MSIIEHLQWRYATKAFDTNKTVSTEDLTHILEAGRLAATSFGLQPFKIIVVTDEAIKAKLVEKAWNQTHVQHNSALLVLAARTDIDEAMISEYTTRIETTRGLPAGSVDGYKDMMVGTLTTRTPEERVMWAQKQCYIALGTMMVAAAERKIDHCPMEGFDPAAFDEILGLAAKNLHATVILPIGYRSSEDATQHYAKVRQPMNVFVETI